MLTLQTDSHSLVHRAWRWVAWLLLLGLAACGVADQGAANQPAANPPTRAPSTVPAAPAAGLTAVPAATPAPILGAQPVGTPVGRIIDIATPAATPTAAAARAAWQTYQSASGGYTVEYPVGWTVQEQAGADGMVTTTFTPSSGGAGISVAVQPTQPDQQEPLDLPNTHCQQVPGNRGIATRCLDTIALTTSTTFISQGRTYTISTAGKGMDQHVYQHMLDSFAPAAPATGQPQTDLEPLLLQPGDLPDTIAAERADDPAPPNFADDPPAARIVGLRLSHAGRGAGSVSVLLYDSPADLAQAYQRLTASVLADAGAGNAAPPPPDIGEQAVTARVTLASSTYGPSHVAVIVFARCHALIDLRLTEGDGTTLDTAIAYARRLDTRVAALPCSAPKP